MAVERSLLLCVMLGACCFPVHAAAAQAGDATEANPLWEWERTLGEFRKAGALIGRAEYNEARLLLGDCGRRLPQPYASMATKILYRLEGALHESDALNGYYRFGQLSEICAELHAYSAAAEFGRKAVQAHPENHYSYGRTLGWCLVEMGDLEGALAEYQRMAERDEPADWKEHWRKQIDLVAKRPDTLADPQFALRYISEHYMSGREVVEDHFGALVELKRILPFVKTSEDKLQVYAQFISSLSKLSDERGAVAWEERTLREFAHDADTCADVYVRRGQRAYGVGQLDLALKLYRRASEAYPGSRSYGVAQFNVGHILQRQKKYKEAIAEFTKLYGSDVNDQDPGANLMQAYRNYRYSAALQVSECYEAERDYVNALKHAELARGKYSYRSWCGSCSFLAAEDLKKRIERLQRLSGP